MFGFQSGGPLWLKDFSKTFIYRVINLNMNDFRFPVATERTNLNLSDLLLPVASQIIMRWCRWTNTKCKGPRRGVDHKKNITCKGHRYAIQRFGRSWEHKRCMTAIEYGNCVYNREFERLLGGYVFTNGHEMVMVVRENVLATGVALNPDIIMIWRLLRQNQRLNVETVCHGINVNLSDSCVSISSQILMRFKGRHVHPTDKHYHKMSSRVTHMRVSST